VTVPDPFELVADLTYGELIASLRQDLLLDATTDLLPGSVLSSLIDKNGQANFLQLLSKQQLQISVGQNAVNWPGASNNANIVQINHGLGRIPAVVHLTPRANTGVFSWFVQLDGPQAVPTATQFSVGGYCSATQPANGTISGFHWTAIG
jgi:hypothetical protein